MSQTIEVEQFVKIESDKALQIRKTELRKVVVTSFAFLLAVSFIVAISVWRGMDGLNDSIVWVQHTYEVKVELNKLLKFHIDAETGQRGFLYTEEEKFLEPYDLAIQEIDKSMGLLQHLVRDNPAQLARIEEIKGYSRWEDKIAMQKLFKSKKYEIPSFARLSPISPASRFGFNLV